MWEGVSVGDTIDDIRGCRRCWSFAAGGGLLVGLDQEQSWCLCGGRLQKEGDEVCLRVKIQLLHFDIALGFLSFCFMHHHSSVAHHPLFFY